MSIKMNTRDTLRLWDNLIKEFPIAITVATDEHINDVFGETQILVPKKTLALAESGKVVHNKTSRYRASFSIWYGDESEPLDYAAAVHEILKASHAPPTQAKFVEQPLIESIKACKKKIVSAAKKVKRSALK